MSEVRSALINLSLIVPAIVLVIYCFKEEFKTSKYEQAMSNKEKFIKKTAIRDIKFIKRKIKQMIKEGKTYDYYIYNPECSNITQYIKDNKLFSDCEINIISVDTAVIDHYWCSAIEIKFLEVK